MSFQPFSDKNYAFRWRNTAFRFDVTWGWLIMTITCHITWKNVKIMPYKRNVILIKGAKFKWNHPLREGRDLWDSLTFCQNTKVLVAGVQEVSQAFSQFLVEYLVMLCNWHIDSDMVDVTFLYDLSGSTHDMTGDFYCF